MKERKYWHASFPGWTPRPFDVVIAAVRQRGTIAPVVDGRIAQAPS